MLVLVYGRVVITSFGTSSIVTPVAQDTIWTPIEIAQWNRQPRVCD